MNRRDVIRGIALAGAALGAGEAAAADQPADRGTSIERDGLRFWLETSLRRVYPTSPAGTAGSLDMLAARGEKLSFQACFKNGKTNSAIVRCEVVAPQDWGVRVRRVGFVPMQHLDTYTPKDELEGIGFIPGLCPDPLFPETTAHIGPEANGVFWISLRTPEGAEPGVHEVRVRLTLENEYGYTDFVRPEPWTVELPVRVDVRPLVLQARREFPVTNWISADSIWEWHRIEPCGEDFWRLAEAYLRNLVEHGVDVAYTPLFNIRHEILERPAQLLKVRRTAPDRYEFDFSDVRRWVRIARKVGATYLEWPHFFTPAPTSARHPQRIFERDAEGFGPMLWAPEIAATSDAYRAFLGQFLPAFKSMLEEEQVLDRSLFHCADEPDGDVQMADYRKARALLTELAPWMKVMDAMSDPRFATERLSDMPIPSIATAHAFTAAGCPAWAYFCCGPRDRFLQRLLDTPLAKIRMAGWLFYKLQARGFLHWGYNYWFVFCTSKIGDPFQDASVGAWPGMPYGDAFVVYPGSDGPLDSIRWEVFAESLQDYALLQSAGVRPDDPLLASIADYSDFPKTADWLTEARRKILARA
ncbi:DUF4091 domain-containing protein [Planctomyces sp. SH-PL62]|uniref:DUF4091 domain-containing protein n=1 Tax=Planctomyces sp. SH-PL62 TaxID=1636152 RepID=UPI00078D883C|nr:DUF4091 domain-containing protein [Planctomyces sp. SH-PL62]AMV39641.1 hypothetical protein VT85_19555 [Planctomyces sp. SH-PL62]